MRFFNNKNRVAAISLLTIFIFCATSLSAYADLRGDYNKVSDKCNSASTPQDEKDQNCWAAGMIERKIAVDDSFANVKSRVDAMIKNDPRRDNASKALKTAEEKKNAFINIIYDTDSTEILNDKALDEKRNEFNKAEKDAISAITAVNRELLSPSQPGNVPKGDVINDFIPGLIRILFRFAFFAVLISFLISGVFFVIAFSNEQRITSAKNMLYYSLIGFVFIVLAFALVKAVTNIDFFGFI